MHILLTEPAETRRMQEISNRCDLLRDLSLDTRFRGVRASHRFSSNLDLTLGLRGLQTVMNKASHSADQSTPRKKAVRLVDIAKRAGVSVSVVGSVLNGGRGNSRVAETTADKIVAIAKELNYRASPTAQQLRGKRSRVFGLLVASAGDPLTSYLVEHLDEEAVKLGCQTLIGNTAIAPGRFESCVDELLNRGVDGIFCVVHSIFPGDRAKLLERCPHTVFYRDPGLPNATFVEVDQYAAGQSAVNHLAATGRRRIGFAILDPKLPELGERLRGVKDALVAKGLSPDALAVYRGKPGSAQPERPDERTMLWRTPDAVLDSIIDQLVVQHRADAIIAHNDFVASALLKRMRHRGMRTPEDVAVVGYLNHYLCEYVDPPLTSIDLRHHAAATAIVQAVQEMIEDPSESIHARREILITPEIIIRESA
jgi:LacI family transcriptional regulator